eukprot:6061931-Lingulodinium_polyedra.AAC.1
MLPVWRHAASVSRSSRDGGGGSGPQGRTPCMTPPVAEPCEGIVPRRFFGGDGRRAPMSKS